MYLNRIINLLFPPPKPFFRRNYQWRTLRLYAHTLYDLAGRATEKGKTVPEYLDYLMEYVKQLEAEIKRLRKEIKKLENEISNLKAKLSKCKGDA